MKKDLVPVSMAKELRGLYNRDVQQWWANYYEEEPADKWRIVPDGVTSIAWMEYPAPELHEMQKWFREEYGIHVTSDPNASGWVWIIEKTNGTFISSSDWDGPNAGGAWDTYEQAMIAGIQEALNRIK